MICCNATLHTELRRIKDGGHTALDQTSPASPAPYQSFMLRCVHGTVYRGYVHMQGGLYSSPHYKVSVWFSYNDGRNDGYRWSLHRFPL